MLRSLLNSEITNTNGAINPCHSPSQNPATETFSPGAPFIWLGPGTQPANIASNSKTTMSAATFMVDPPTSCYVRRGGIVSSPHSIKGRHSSRSEHTAEGRCETIRKAGPLVALSPVAAATSLALLRDDKKKERTCFGAAGSRAPSKHHMRM